jgi:hypothetical protein
MEILKLISLLRDSDPYIRTIYTEGGCYRFHLFLREIWMEAIPVTNEKSDHVGSLIDGEVYDIDGIVNWSWRPMDDVDIEQAKTWNFANNSFLQIGECPVCEEPIVV